jgi:hypothetical protein
MRILRRHQGFTTNSSASSEWYSDPIEPSKPLTAVGLANLPVPGATAAATPAATSTGAGATTGAHAVSATTPVTVPVSRPTVLWDNLQVVGGLLLAVLGIFALERWIRRRLRRRDDDDG